MGLDFSLHSKVLRVNFSSKSCSEKEEGKMGLDFELHSKVLKSQFLVQIM